MLRLSHAGAALAGAAVTLVFLEGLRRVRLKRGDSLAPVVGVERRASIDVGSGATKLLVADIDAASGAIKQILYGEERVVSFSLASKSTPDNSLPENVMERGIQVLRDFQRIVASLSPAGHPPLGIAAVATEVFRKAPNGRQYLGRVWRELGLDVRLVSQAVEAELGFMTAAAFALGEEEGGGIGDIVCLDSGGGSFQISAYAPPPEAEAEAATVKSAEKKSGLPLRRPYLGSLGSGIVVAQCAALLESDQAMIGAADGSGGDVRRDCVQPLNKRQFELLVQHLMAQMAPLQGDGGAAGDSSFAWIGACEVVTAIGGPTSQCRLPGAILGWDNLPSRRAHGGGAHGGGDCGGGDCGGDGNPRCVFTAEDVEAAADAILGKTDQEVGEMPVRDCCGVKEGEGEPGDTDRPGTRPPQAECFRAGGLEPHLVTTKLALLLATMRHTGMRAVRYCFAVGSCPGVLVHPSFRSFSVAAIDT
jgi:hypothetical protein